MKVSYLRGIVNYIFVSDSVGLEAVQKLLGRSTKAAASRVDKELALQSIKVR